MEFTKYKGKCVDNSSRGIKQETTKRYQYQTNEEGLEIANFYRDGVLLAQHIRKPDKKHVKKRLLCYYWEFFFWHINLISVADASPKLSTHPAAEKYNIKPGHHWEGDS